MKVRPGLKQRLAESFEAALRLASDRAICYEIDSNASNRDDASSPKEYLFNAKFACPVCS